MNHIAFSVGGLVALRGFCAAVPFGIGAAAGATTLAGVTRVGAAAVLVVLAARIDPAIV